MSKIMTLVTRSKEPEFDLEHLIDNLDVFEYMIHDVYHELCTYDRLTASGVNMYSPIEEVVNAYDHFQKACDLLREIRSAFCLNITAVDAYRYCMPTESIA